MLVTRLLSICCRAFLLLLIRFSASTSVLVRKVSSGPGYHFLDDKSVPTEDGQIEIEDFLLFFRTNRLMYQSRYEVLSFKSTGNADVDVDEYEHGTLK